MHERRPFRSFVSYIDRSREYYAAHGYEKPYGWACHGSAPFAPLKKPLAQSRIGLVTTASYIDLLASDEAFKQGRAPYAAPSDPPPERLYVDHLFWDRDATHTDDVESFLPLRRLSEFAGAGRIGSASKRFYGVPTEYSQGRTRTKDAPQVLEWVQEDGVDAVLLSAL